MQNHHHVDSFTENCWCYVIDYSSLLDDGAPPPAVVSEPSPPPSENVCMSIDGITSPALKSHEEREFSRKRGHSDLNDGKGTKACRERERRGKLNDRFIELSAVLGRESIGKTEKLTMLNDAIRLLKQLKTESQEYMHMNTRLTEEIKILKVEKNEFREEKAKLKEDKERIEQQLNMYEANAAKKVPMLPSYGFVPMWQYLPSSVRDTTVDHVLRPPAA
ncbi:transcription factor bHLH104-like [Salvia splendens]|uniref:transcription factor bHLH104-like n=1 Tax=Salvia splendens TaxID=180675 RepID=UPI001100E198|nr:transcription factor bHLH104-like [Salvia splendens]